ncbi:ATP-binding protein [Acidimicrobiia bacterium EGI L10123]|uniref:ATP-binding protein n=1 Tax=Salinilacustrithrix flava TaxID=2957203 RepID=UPI003D7C2CE2|nr:ATP-binding protein [Acidimicrobiia bacterium EGI L10123]
MAEIVLEIPPRLDYLAVVRLVVATAASLDPPLPDSRLDDLRLAVTEACSNAIKAHRPEAADQPVVISCHLDEDLFRVQIRDRGPGFDPDALTRLPAPTDPNRLQHESGLGIPLIKVLTDDVTFEPAGDGTIVSMTLKRPTAPPI